MPEAAPHATFALDPPKRLRTLASLRVAEMRSRVGSATGPEWGRAVSMRDPVSILKRTHPHVNRATFKLHEIVSRLFSDEHDGGRLPRTAAFLAEAPGGFLYCARQLWPHCECHAMSSSAEGAIAFATPDDPAILGGLPHEGDLRHAAVEEALVQRCGAASADVVSADGGTEIADLSCAEQQITSLVLAQAAVALRLQAQGGCLVLKVFEGCTLPTRQLFEVLRQLYQKIMLFKPRSSKVCNSERYVVAMGLKSPVVAREVAKRLRSIVERCVASKEFVTSLGVEVGELTQQAFDLMAAEQADAIAQMLTCIATRRVGGLRALAATEAKEIERLFGAYCGDRRCGSVGSGP